ncbi:DUF4062 domain-containing protein [Exiguobacterium acetylicum]|uniref:DUF4062 domain-containing protein n=1 Tax=Exiguobacterium acetylicum TaxID=41170 RepID=UPI001CA70319|nr:DUF4062 domain-containing protein [Exiguobacterium acetylicum]QZY88633.1 DUF4062 domain-containing protein [Exiguobacterium acetylicum]
MEKRMQVFISSTFSDLINERQYAVQAILNSNHIPAGMELFKAGNDDQLTVIKRWIDESDIYMLILGGRYGTIEPKSGKSYTHIEYEYAIEKNIPVFTLILDDQMLENKLSDLGGKHYDKVYETENAQKYREFKDQVSGHNKIVSFPVNVNDLQYQTVNSINYILKLHSLDGWIKASSSKLLKENQDLKEEIIKLKQNLETKEICVLPKLTDVSKANNKQEIPQTHFLKNKDSDDYSTIYEVFLTPDPTINNISGFTMREIVDYLKHDYIVINLPYELRLKSRLMNSHLSKLNFFANPLVGQKLISGILAVSPENDELDQTIVQGLIPSLSRFNLITTNFLPNEAFPYSYVLNINGVFVLEKFEIIKT